MIALFLSIAWVLMIALVLSIAWALMISLVLSIAWVLMIALVLSIAWMLNAIIKTNSMGDKYSIINDNISYKYMHGC